MPGDSLVKKSNERDYAVAAGRAAAHLDLRTGLADEDGRRLWLPLALAFTALASYFEVRELETAAARIFASYLFFDGLLLAGTQASNE